MHPDIFIMFLMTPVRITLFLLHVVLFSLFVHLQEQAHCAQGGSQFQKVYVENGTLYFENGSEVALWGVNFQTSMSWDYDRFKKRGLYTPFVLEEYQGMVNRSFDEIELMGCDVIRIHLSPGDFTDADGNLIENEWLAMLDYTLAECRKRGIYVNFALLNDLGQRIKTSFASGKRQKDAKTEWIVVPEKIEASENYIRQLVNRENPYDGLKYKDNPAWIIAEFINEPMFYTEKPSVDDAQNVARIYEQWLIDQDKDYSDKSFSTFKYQSIFSYINRIQYLLDDEGVTAVPCWNLFWVKGPQHEGWESYEAAINSNIKLVSFSTYPGQTEIQLAHQKSIDLSSKNFLPYLQRAYDEPDWQGWLREERFQKTHARIVYEYEAWANQSAYIYPAMAMYFRSQGAQIATMWTYSFPTLAEYFPKTQNHNLNIQTTPTKSAGFLAAGQIFRNTPRYLPYPKNANVSGSESSTHFAYSYVDDWAVYADQETYISTGDVIGTVLDLSGDYDRIVGVGHSPFVEYNGSGIYYLERDSEMEGETWILCILPDASWIEAIDEYSKSVCLDEEQSHQLTLHFKNDFSRTNVYACRSGDSSDQLVKSFGEGQEIELFIRPGKYLIERR